MKKLTKEQQRVLKDIEAIIVDSNLDNSDITFIVHQLITKLYQKAYVVCLTEVEDTAYVYRFNHGMTTHELLGVIESTKYDIINGAKNNKPVTKVKRYVSR